LSKPCAGQVNPPDLWIHGNAADAGDRMSNDDRDSSVRPSLHASRSDRIGSSTSVLGLYMQLLKITQNGFHQNVQNEDSNAVFK